MPPKSRGKKTVEVSKRRKTRLKSRSQSNVLTEDTSCATTGVFDFTEDEDNDFQSSKAKKSKSSKSYSKRNRKQNGCDDDSKGRETTKKVLNVSESSLLKSAEVKVDDLNGMVTAFPFESEVTMAKSGHSEELPCDIGNGAISPCSSSQDSDLPSLCTLTSQDNTERSPQPSPGTENQTKPTLLGGFSDLVNNFNYVSRDKAVGKACSSAMLFDDDNSKGMSYADTDNDALIATELQKEEDAKVTKSQDVSFHYCQFCFKDLSHFNSIRKQQHINRCCDANGDTMIAEKAAASKQPEEKQQKKLSCPICGRVTKTEKGRKLHLKGCSKKNNISTVELISLLKALEDEDTPSCTENKESIITGEKAQVSNGSTTVKTTTIKVTKKRSKKNLDENVQVALALSASESSLRNDENRRRRLAKRAKVLTELPDLIMTSEEDRKQKVDQRAISLVKENETEEISCTPALNPSKVAERYALTEVMDEKVDIDKNSEGCNDLQSKRMDDEVSNQSNTDADMTDGAKGDASPKRKTESERDSNTEKENNSLQKFRKGKNPLWDLAAAEEDLVNERPFYVKALLSVLETKDEIMVTRKEKDKVRGSAADKVSENIRERTDDARETGTHRDECVLKGSQGKESDASVTSDSQMAHILVDLVGDDNASESDDDNDDDMAATADVSKESNVRLSGDGFIKKSLSAEAEGELSTLKSIAREQMVTDFESLLFSNEMSDLEILCRHGIKIPAHKLVLSVRSVRLKELLTANSSCVDISEFSEHAIRAVLRYLYCGDVALDSSIVADVLQIANRFHLETLQKTCQFYLQQDPTLSIPDSTASCDRSIDNRADAIDNTEDLDENDEDDTELDDLDIRLDEDDWLQASVNVLLEQSFTHDDHTPIIPEDEEQSRLISEEMELVTTECEEKQGDASSSEAEDAEVNRKDQEANCEEEEVNCNDEEVIHEDEEDIKENEEVNHEKEEVNYEDEEFNHKDEEVNHEDEEVNCEDGEVNHENEEVNHEDEEVNREKEEVNHKDEEVNHKDEEVNHEDEEVNHEDEEVNCEDGEVNHEDEEVNCEDKEVNREDKEVYCEDDFIVGSPPLFEDDSLLQLSDNVLNEEHAENSGEKAGKNIFTTLDLATKKRQQSNNNIAESSVSPSFEYRSENDFVNEDTGRRNDLAFQTSRQSSEDLSSLSSMSDTEADILNTCMSQDAPSQSKPDSANVGIHTSSYNFAHDNDVVILDSDSDIDGGLFETQKYPEESESQSSANITGRMSKGEFNDVNTIDLISPDLVENGDLVQADSDVVKLDDASDTDLSSPCRSLPSPNYASSLADNVNDEQPCKNTECVKTDLSDVECSLRGDSVRNAQLSGNDEVSNDGSVEDADLERHDDIQDKTEDMVQNTDYNDIDEDLLQYHRSFSLILSDTDKEEENARTKESPMNDSSVVKTTIVAISSGKSSPSSISCGGYEDDGGFNCDIVQYDIPSSASPTPPGTPGRDDSNPPILDVTADRREGSPKPSCSHSNQFVSERDSVTPTSSKINLDDSLIEHLDDIAEDSEPIESVGIDHSNSVVTPTKDVPRSSNDKFGPGDYKHPETGENITPFPDYAQMQTPELKAKAKIFALRQNLSKKVIIAKLKEIYKYQHNFTDWESTPVQQKTKGGRKRKQADQQKGNTKKSSRNDNSKDTTKEVPCSSSSSRKDTQKVVVETKSNDDVIHDDDSSSSSESCHDDFEKHCLGSEEELDNFTQDQAVKDTVVPLSTRLTEFIQGDRDLYSDILTYKPLNFDELRTRLKDGGIKCSKDKLLDYLDHQCICFTAPRPKNAVGKSRRRWKRSKRDIPPD